MKKFYFLLIFITFSFGKGFSQTCTSFGCAKSEVVHAITSGASVIADPGLACWAGGGYKQIYWQFFYANASANFTQTYHQTSTGGPINLNYILFDAGTTAPPSITCPVDASSWTTALDCNTTSTDHGSADVGPGVGWPGDALVTTSGHYYAIAIIIWVGSDNIGDPSYDFTISAPMLGGNPFTSANCPGILPVKLSSFDAKVDNCTIQLNWTATSETNFKNYEVQYSNNGTNFQTLGSVSAALQNNITQKYSYQPVNPQQGKVFYRLKMVDIDGKFEYSKIIALKLDCNRSSTIVYPNPVTDILNVNITNAQNNLTTANLFDSYGKLIYNSKLISGTNTINMAKFAKGVYLLTLRSGTETQNIKIVK